MGTAAIQRALWSGSPRDWAELQEPQFSPLYQSVLDSVGVREGTTVLDVGCGTGVFCSLAAMCGASVAGIDASEGQIAIARERTPSGDFRVGEMEELPFADASFDLVSGFNSFQFAADPVNALRQAKRVTKPTGAVAIAVWGLPKDCQAAVLLKAMSSLLPPPPPGTPGPFALSEPGIVEDTLAKAGLKPGRAVDVDVPFEFADDETGYRAMAASGPGTRAIRVAGRDKLHAALLAALAPFKSARGTCHLANKFRFVIARP